MPAIFTHVQFGKEVAAGLSPALQALVSAHEESFYLGTQGPDLLFYHKLLKSKKKNPARKLGWDMHERTSEAFFLAATEKLFADGENLEDGEFFPKSAAAAYTLGFLCHYVLDSTCHPTIDKASVDGLTHGKIESELDKYILRRAGMPVRGFNAATLFFPEEEAKRASAAILGVREEETGRAMRSMRKINKLFSHKCGFVHGVCHAALTLVGMNGSFGQMFLHKKEDTRCKELLPRLEGLFEGAIPLAREQIEAFFAHLPRHAEVDSLETNFYRSNYSGDKEE